MLGWSLAVAATLTAWPQAIRALRGGDIRGIDANTVTTAIATMAAWTAYTAYLHDVPAIVSSVGPLLAWMLVLFALLAAESPGIRRAGCVSLAAAAFVTILVLTGYANLVGAAAAIGSAAWALPQLVTVLRRVPLSGVSVAAYSALAIENLGWVAYAAGTGIAAYAIGPLVQAPAAAVIAWRARQWHRRSEAMTLHPSAVSLGVDTC